MHFLFNSIHIILIILSTLLIDIAEVKKEIIIICSEIDIQIYTLPLILLLVA